MGAFASKMGSGAAKIGKKVAQSEAGRSAGRAAVKGATDAAAKDFSDRYFGEPPPSAPTPTARKISTPSSTDTSTTTSREQTSSSEERIPRVDSYSGTRPPPKPSVLSRFKPVINIRGGQTAATKPQRRARPPQEKRVYKHRLAKEPDWERLPQAVTLYNFRGEMKCDLQFRKGQVIKILTRTDTQNDWWEGKIEDRVGIFPANYVKLM